MKRGKQRGDLHFSVCCACVYLVWYRGMAAVPESANRIGKPCKMKQNLTMLQGQGCRARIVKLHWKSLQNEAKRLRADKQVYPPGAFFGCRSALAGPGARPRPPGGPRCPPRENVEKAWEFMYFPAWRPGRLQGASLQARARPGAPRGSGKTWKK